jgi:glutamate synthase domain-containing protein 3
MTEDKIFLVKASKETISNRNMDFVELTPEELELLKNLIIQHIGKFDRKHDKALLKKLEMIK